MLQAVEEVDTSSHGIDTITAITVAIEDKIDTSSNSVQGDRWYCLFGNALLFDILHMFDTSLW